MSVKKYMVTIINDDSMDVDKVHDALEGITDGHLTVWSEAEQKSKTSKEGRRK